MGSGLCFVAIEADYMAPILMWTVINYYLRSNRKKSGCPGFYKENIEYVFENIRFWPPV